MPLTLTPQLLDSLAAFMAAHDQREAAAFDTEAPIEQKDAERYARASRECDFAAYHFAFSFLLQAKRLGLDAAAVKAEAASCR